jgi:hypothetical protein
MKWNFECESERRDYLHNCVVRRCNGFRAVKRCAALQIRYGTNLFGTIHLAQQTISIGIRNLRRSLPAHQHIQTAISLTAIRLLLGFINRRCARETKLQANRSNDEHEFDSIQIQTPRAPA